MTARPHDTTRGAARLIHRVALAALAALLLAWLASAAQTAQAAPADGGAPNLAYVVSQSKSGPGGYLAAIDIAQRKVTWRVALDAPPTAVQLSVDGRTVFVGEHAANGVALVDARTHRVTDTYATGPTGDLALDVSVTGALFASNAAPWRLAAIDLVRQRVTYISSGQGPSDVGASGLGLAGPGSDSARPQDSEIYVTHPATNSVAIVSATQRKTVASVTIPGGPEAVVAPGTGGLAYVTTRAGTVELVGLSDHTWLGTAYAARGDVFGRMDYDAVTGAIYLPDETRNQVLVLAPASISSDGGATHVPAEPERAYAIAGAPSAVAVTFDGAYGFVTQRDAGSVTMLDLAAHQKLATIAVPGHPVAVVTGAYPPALDAQTSSIVGALLYVLAGAAALAVAGYFFGWFGVARRWLAAQSGKLMGRSRSA